jgi:hypothetical protein
LADGWLFLSAAFSCFFVVRSIASLGSAGCFRDDLPDYFCFQWQDYGPRRGLAERFSTLWFNQGRSVIRWDTSASVTVEDQPSLQFATAAATGCSVGAAILILPMLMDHMRTELKHVLQLTDLELLANESLNEQECYVVKGSLFRAFDHILWVSTNDFSVQKIRHDMSSTAEESRKEHEALIANKQLLAGLLERGITPPSEMKFSDKHEFTDYTYTDITFDESINPLPQPTADDEK